MKEKLKKINEIKNNINLCNKNPSEEQKIKNNLPNKNVLNSTLINLYQKEDTLCDLEKLPKNLNPFGKIFFDVILQEIKPFSKFKYFLSYNVKQFIYKFNDDLRQEFLIMQMIKLFKEIFSIENLPLNLTTYNIIITSNKSGIIEYIPNTISIHSLLKFLNKNKISLANFFTLFFNKNLLEAQKNFAESLAAYSLVCFILNIKDRHNENILLDYNGKIIHIDFGFALGISPGNLNFENAPFKITEDYINILGGIDSEIFVYFKSLFMKGLIAVKKYYKYFENILRLMFDGLFRNINCFEGKEIDEIVENMKKKFFLNLNEKDYNKIVDDIINESINNWRTGYYDYYQKLTNDIEY
jgi:phosphatidylinositol 4-kinase